MFLLLAAYVELNLIQLVTYIHPLQMVIKTLRAQMGSKMLIRVPPDEIASATSSEKLFSRYVSSFSFTIPVSVKYVSLSEKNIELTIFKLFAECILLHVSGPVSMHS